MQFIASLGFVMCVAFIIFLISALVLGNRVMDDFKGKDSKDAGK